MSPTIMNDLFKLDGMVAVVTGGASGIGYMMVKALIGNGAAKVYVLGDKKDALESAAKEIDSPSFIPIHCDVTSKSDLQAAVDQVTFETGHINLLICNAGKAFNSTAKQPTLESSVKEIRNYFFDETTFEEQTAILNLNTTAVLMTSFAFIELLDNGNKISKATSNTPEAGVRSQIIATGSAGAYVRYGLDFSYNASKAATTQMMKHMASSLVPWGIRCNVVAPGWFPSAITAPLIKEFEPTGGVMPKSLVPAERLGREEEMIGTVLYLASTAGAYCNGSVALVDGGVCALYPMVEVIYTATPRMLANGKSNGRFELPQLTPVNFSLTDGTDIPPPLPDSPIEEKPPPPALKTQTQSQPVTTTTITANGRAVTPTIANGNGIHDERSRTSGTDIPPLSPASTTRPSSIRRFLSRKSLNQNFIDGSHHNGQSQEDLAGILRPDSPSSFSTKSKSGGRKSGSWFRRFSSSSAVSRSSAMYEQQKTEHRRGPPPPKLPELNQLEAKIPEDDEGSLGAEDMFKNINLHTHSISPSLPSQSLLLRALATPINPADINQIQGVYPSRPPFTSLLGTSQPSAVGGNEGCFEIASVGSSVKDLQKGDWVIMRSTGFGTWRTHTLASSTDVLKIENKEGLTPIQVGTVSVNPCTAYRMLKDFETLEGGKDWFIQNGANSGVGRAAIQLGKSWGLKSINVIRDRPSKEDTEAMRNELLELGATKVVTESELQSKGFGEQVKEWTNGGREQIKVGLNCVGGKQTLAMTKNLSPSGHLITYGAMSKQPLDLPTGLLIFKDLKFSGFWVSRWSDANPEKKKRTVEEILGMTRKGDFKDVPVQELKWDWGTEEVTLKSAVEGTLEGFRAGKGVFIYGDT
ncbi:hypothetical protein G7Y89_g5036 [Cudoniella acicularis]|uniref:enoyl-[acyl-carrier-protein] reductase n=1 Tax=Cudoniella acicularis TaxID=354080 RepID=A0A8H4RQB1_9HELO|nr:hypothetical protein G7Y89_g5036 [Cudoniella acicularis]